MDSIPIVLQVWIYGGYTALRLSAQLIGRDSCSVKALCDHFGKEQIGIGYKSLANFGIAPDKPYCNKYCTIRKGILLTAPKTGVEALSNNADE